MRGCYTRLLTFLNAAFSNFSKSFFARTTISVVAGEKLLKIDAVAVFNGITSVVRFAFIDIWREKSRVVYSKSTELRAELRGTRDAPLFFEGEGEQFPKKKHSAQQNLLEKKSRKKSYGGKIEPVPSISPAFD